MTDTNDDRDDQTSAPSKDDKVNDPLTNSEVADQVPRPDWGDAPSK